MTQQRPPADEPDATLRHSPGDGPQGGARQPPDEAPPETVSPGDKDTLPGTPAETLVRPPDANEPTAPVAGETLVRPPDGETGTGAETLARPPDDARAPAVAAATGDATLARPASGDEGPNPHEPTLALGDPVEASRRAAEAIRRLEEKQDIKAFGDYDLLSVIAKGGMGVVYKARQRKLKRIVAIKMILAGQFADSTDIGRFYAEAEAAANLRHPNIVGIYEIGEVDGQHFFSMEYVEGASLGDFARENPLPCEQSAEYVKKIAEAMQFAHDRGILHRDLKPSNVLIDASRQPLITDFGLAKRVESESELTMTGSIVGTPSYMPPEQARGEIDKISAASDVYSTGAILYELLTGVPPFRATNPFETIRQVLDAEPAPPRVVNATIPRDLETICLKSLEKEPGARYASEQELADELGRFLRGEPILARPIGSLARGWRWCRRNPVVASLSAAAVTFLILALVGTSVGYVRATIAQRESDQSFRDSRAAVDELFTRVSEDDLLNQPGMQTLRHDLLRRALAYYEKFLRQRGDDPTVRHELASTFFRVGFISAEIRTPRDALAWYARALAIQEELAEASPSAQVLNDMGDTWNGIGVVRHKLGHEGQARAGYAQAIEIRKRVVALEGDGAEHHRELANSMMNLGILLRELDKAAEARQWMEDAQEIREARLDAGGLRLRRDYAQGFYNIAVLEWRAEDLTSADAQFAAAQREFSHLLAEAPNNLWNQWRGATCLRLRADLNASQLDDSSNQPSPEGGESALQQVVARYRQARDLLERLAARNPDVVDYQSALAAVLMNLGSLQQRFQLDTDALNSLQAAVDVLTKIVAAQPSPANRRDLAVTQCELGVQLAIAQRLAEADRLLDESGQRFETLVSEAGRPAAYAGDRERVGQIRAWVDSLIQQAEAESDSSAP